MTITNISPRKSVFYRDGVFLGHVTQYGERFIFHPTGEILHRKDVQLIHQEQSRLTKEYNKSKAIKKRKNVEIN